MNNNKNLMYLLAVGGISIAIALGGAGLGIALRNKSSTTTTVDKGEIISPYAIGRIHDGTIPGIKDAMGTKSFGAFTANDEKTLVISNFWQKVDAIKFAVQQATKGIGIDGKAKWAARLSNAITFKLTTTGINSFNDRAHGAFRVDQTWNKDGKTVYTLKNEDPNSKLGVGKAKTNLFDGKIKKGADLDKYVLFKKDGIANTDGSDAEFALSVDVSGNIQIISKSEIKDKVVKLEATTGIRATSFK